MRRAGPGCITLSTSLSEREAVLGSGHRTRSPQHLAPYLFTPFFTTKAPGEGTGLGLSLSYGLVKTHRGTLTYHPAANGGAEFQVTLPRFEGGGSGRRPRPSNEGATSAGRPPDPGGG